MVNVIVVFPKIEEANSIRNILVRHGFFVTAVCTNGAQALNAAGNLRDGIVVCGYRYADMLYNELHEYLPSEFEMLLLASPARYSDSGIPDVLCLSMPLKVHELVQAVESIAESCRRKRRLEGRRNKGRSPEEAELLERAKAVLIEKKGMTETQAHRYIQKSSMDNCRGMTETARMLLRLYS